jgi:hypothetical protein
VNRLAGAAADKRGPAVDENILQGRGEAALLPQRMVCS